MADTLESCDTTGKLESCDTTDWASIEPHTELPDWFKEAEDDLIRDARKRINKYRKYYEQRRHKSIGSMEFFKFLLNNDVPLEEYREVRRYALWLQKIGKDI